MELRANQIEAKKKGIEFFESKKKSPSIIVMPTAAGKSIVIAEIAKNIDAEKVVVLQPSVELLKQNYEKFLLTGEEASVFSASAKRKENNERVVYATLGSILKHSKQFANCKLLIDESHMYPRNVEGMLSKFIKGANIGNEILGLTASPLKLQTNSAGGWESYSILKMLTSRSKHGNLFKDILYVSQIEEMVKNGWWSPLKYESYSPVHENILEFNTANSEFTNESLNEFYDSNNVESKIINDILAHPERDSVLVSVPSIEKAISMTSKLNGSVAVYSGMGDKNREWAIKGFKDGSIKRAINVNMLSVGFDHPYLKWVIGGRATASLAWFYQFLGRVSRIHPEKKEGIITDYSGNVDKFGKIEELKFVKQNKWKLFGENNKLITDIPMTEIGMHTIETEEIKIKQNNGMSFHVGKYKGKELKDVPANYMRWALNEFNWEEHSKLKKNIEKILNVKI